MKQFVRGCTADKATERKFLQSQYPENWIRTTHPVSSFISTPFLFFLSSTLDLFSLSMPSLSTWPLFLSLKTQGISVYYVFRYSGLKFWVFIRDFLRGYALSSPSIVLSVLREVIRH